MLMFLSRNALLVGDPSPFEAEATAVGFFVGVILSRKRATQEDFTGGPMMGLGGGISQMNSPSRTLNATGEDTIAESPSGGTTDCTELGGLKDEPGVEESVLSI